MTTREFHWRLTGWPALAVILALWAIPVAGIFALGFWVGAST